MIALRLVLWIVCASLSWTSCWGFSRQHGRPPSSSSSWKLSLRSSSRSQLGASSQQDEEHSSSASLLASTSFLSHAMLKVPNVDETVEYWTQTHGAQIRISRPVSKNEDNTNTDTPMTTHADGTKPARLASAFVELGNAVTSHQEDPQTTKNPITSFALEVVGTKISKDAYSIGNCISYIGMSMLLTYQMTQPDGLLNVIRSAKTPPPGVELPPPQPDQEINGIPIQSVASAPGDYFASDGRLLYHRLGYEHQGTR